MDIKHINQYNHLVVRLNMQQCLSTPQENFIALFCKVINSIN